MKKTTLLTIVAFLSMTAIAFAQQTAQTTTKTKTVVKENIDGTVMVENTNTATHSTPTKTTTAKSTTKQKTKATEAKPKN